MKRFLLCALLLGVTLPSFAEVPKLISYSGKITDKNGKIVADADYVMTFSLYDSQTNGTVKWTETQTVNLAGGAYHVFLGSVNPNFPKFEQNYWLEVEFKGKKFGRQQIVSTPYALRAQYANESESLVTAAMNAILPIGSIIAWHKNFDGLTPSLPSSFMECNGDEVSDKDSPYFRKNVPDLNKTKRFIRGSVFSGVTQTAQIESHNHNVSGYGLIRKSVPGEIKTNNGTDSNGAGSEPDIVSAPVNMPNYGNTETRPVNMSMVWIIRIK